VSSSSSGVTLADLDRWAAACERAADAAAEAAALLQMGRVDEARPLLLQPATPAVSCAGA
jgi:hypothetical protein